MKALFPWVLVLLCGLGFGVLVDKGQTHLGVPDFVWLAVNLTLFLYILQRFVGRPMAAFLDTRREGIGAELAAASAKLAEADRLRSEVMARLDAVEHEVTELRQRAEREGAAEAAKIAEQAAVEQQRFLRRVEDEIQRRQAETRQALARETAELTAQLTRELLAAEMTDADRRRVFDRSVAALDALQAED